MQAIVPGRADSYDSRPLDAPRVLAAFIGLADSAPSSGEVFFARYLHTYSRLPHLNTYAEDCQGSYVANILAAGNFDRTTRWEGIE